jgi:PPOX class probable F420-dependent enzyme
VADDRAPGRAAGQRAWFLLRDDETILVYSQAAKIKLRNIGQNPRVALGLDVTDIGRDIIRIDGTAEHVPGFPPADQVPGYVTKYAERIGANFGTAGQFAAQFPEPLIITPHRLYA